MCFASRPARSVLLLWLAISPCRGLADWTAQFGTSGSDDANAIAVYGTGVFVAGDAFGALPGQIGAGGPDAFVRKYDRKGTHIWTVQFGTPNWDQALGLAVNQSGVYVVGYTTGTLAGQTSAGTYDAFIRKYDLEGNPSWTRQFGTSMDDIALAVTVDLSGIYVAGWTGGALEGQTSKGNGDVFLRKYDVNGNLLWTRQFGTLGNDDGMAVAATGSAVYIGGHATGLLPGTTGPGYCYVRKYDVNGNPLWTRQFDAYSDTRLSGLAVDSSGVYAVGSTLGIFPDQVTVNINAFDGYLRKYDLNGGHLWTRQFGSYGQTYAYGVAADGAVVSIVGQTSSDPLSQDAFVRKYDANGSLLRVEQFGTGQADGGRSAASDDGDLYIAGFTHGTLPGQASAGSSDAFVQRMDGVRPTLMFIATQPCRIIDTRPGQGTNGPFGPPTLSANSARTIPIPEGRCGVPVSAQAYSLNVTVVPQEPLGYLTLWPAGEPQPVVSTLNSFHGGVVANAAIVQAGAGGAINAFVTNRTDLIVDLNGYFTAEPNPQSLSFYPLDPCRTVDTRSFIGPFGPPSLAAGATRSFALSNSSCRIPTWAAAHSLNATVVPDKTLGYLTLWPTGQPQPFVSTLNSFDGTVVANAAIVPAGTDGAISAIATDKTELILDTNGFFGPPGNPGERTFRPVAPCRVADTRMEGAGGQMFGGETRNFTVSGKCGVPIDAKAYALNVTVVPQGPISYLTLWPAGSTMPIVSTLNSYLGRVVANAALVPAGTDGALSVYVTNPTHVILDINGYFQ